MKVFVVKHNTDYAFGDSTKSGIEGVCSSRERAEQEIARRTKNANWAYDDIYYDIEEHEVE